MPSKPVLPYKRRRGQCSGFKRSDKRFQNRKRRIERMPPLLVLREGKRIRGWAHVVLGGEKQLKEWA
jgi:hypothetical protein